jgi:hypothetical protein
MICEKCGKNMENKYTFPSTGPMVFGHSYIPVHLFQCPHCKNVDVGKLRRND